MWCKILEWFGVVKWTECIWTKFMQCRFCRHMHRNYEGYPNVYVDDVIGVNHLRRLVRSHMELCHPEKHVWYHGRLWG